MSVLDMIGQILIGPLKTIFELIFSVALTVIKHPGPAIMVLSLMMNILVLPLYRRADAIQEEARDTENKLKDVVAHIKKTFSGDERMMILQTYYRQNNYNPLSVLSGSISLLLEIPFFMAAYQFLSSVQAFQGVSFGPIADLSKPDNLLVIGSISINVLPFIMTLVNVVSSSLYLKGFPLKTKIQLYGMALFFLVFLYNSPAALVFYWTLNNTFSLVKTLFYRIKNSKQVLKVFLAVVGAAAIALGIYLAGLWRTTFLVTVGLVCQLPWVLPLIQAKLPVHESKPAKPNTSFFVLGAMFLTVLVGLLIPSAYVSASPQEYIDPNYFYNPIWYVINTLCLSAGTFLVWLGVFYWLANDKGKVIFSRLVWALCGIMVVNYMFFGTKLGVVSPDLQYTEGFIFGRKEQLLNIAVVLALLVGLYFLAAKFAKALPTILLIGTIALAAMGIYNTVQIADAAEETRIQLSKSEDRFPSFSLSKDGQNVVVIMLDRAIGPFVPYLMEENPQLLEQYDGFTYYANTLSYGVCTNFAAPALYGGYEYTPLELNLRDAERLVDKHNEALKVMPAIFAQADYAVSVIDPSLAGYSWIPDLTIYDDIPGVEAYLAEGKFNDIEDRIHRIESRQRNFFYFSLMKTLPTILQDPIYNNGTYRKIPTTTVDLSAADPTLALFMEPYNVLKNIDTITHVTKGNDNTFMFLRSNATHNPVVLQEPDFTPAISVDNNAYYPEEGKTITAGDQAFLLGSNYAISHYHANMSALMQLADWFDYLRDNGVYDNTRIILVSDHGRDMGVLNGLEGYTPLLMVKDFNAKGFTTSSTFMTNADVPTLATDGLINNPVNPYTGNAINSAYKNEHDRQYVIVSTEYDIHKNKGNQFLPSEWATVTGDVRDLDNWEFSSELSVLPPDLTK